MVTTQENLWHYSDGNSTFGPLPSTTIRQLINAGVIHSNFLICRDGENFWAHYREVDLDASPIPAIKSPPPSLPPPPPDDKASFYITRNGVNSGPYPASEVREMILSRKVMATDLVWSEGMGDWSPAANVPALRLAGNVLPPPPPPSPPQTATKGRNAFQYYFSDVLINQYIDFKSRSSRKQYWMFTFFYLVGAFCTGFVDGILGFDGTISGLYSLTMILPIISIGVRRVQDGDHNGWWALCPVVNLILALTEGTRGENRFGPDPRQAGRRA